MMRDEVVLSSVLPNGTVLLEFSGGHAGAYVVRGGVCWPVPSPVVPGAFVGYLVVCGREVLPDRVGRVYVFDESPFSILENAVEHGRITHGGAISVMQRWRGQYGVTTYFQNQETDVCARYQRALKLSENVQPKPRMVSVSWGNRPYPLTALDYGDVRYFADGGVAEALVRYRTMPQTFDTVPAELRAVSCALAGLERLRVHPLTREDVMGPDW